MNKTSLFLLMGEEQSFHQPAIDMQMMINSQGGW